MVNNSQMVQTLHNNPTSNSIEKCLIPNRRSKPENISRIKYTRKVTKAAVKRRKWTTGSKVFWSLLSSCGAPKRFDFPHLTGKKCFQTFFSATNLSDMFSIIKLLSEKKRGGNTWTCGGLERTLKNHKGGCKTSPAATPRPPTASGCLLGVMN